MLWGHLWAKLAFRAPVILSVENFQSSAVCRTIATSWFCPLTFLNHDAAFNIVCFCKPIAKQYLATCFTYDCRLAVLHIGYIV